MTGLKAPLPNYQPVFASASPGQALPWQRRLKVRLLVDCFFSASMNTCPAAVSCDVQAASKAIAEADPHTRRSGKVEDSGNAENGKRELQLHGF
jgi:hypothetical protein